jgi:hypothetical protein
MSDAVELAKLQADVEELQLTVASLITAVTRDSGVILPVPPEWAAFVSAHGTGSTSPSSQRHIDADSLGADTGVLEDPSGATYRKVGNDVTLGGEVPGGNSSLIFLLPQGFRPAKELSFSARRDNGEVVTVHVMPDGSVMTELGEGAVQLDSITFPTI